MDEKSIPEKQTNTQPAENLKIFLREIPEESYYVNPCNEMPLEQIEKLEKNNNIVLVSEKKATNIYVL